MNAVIRPRAREDVIRQFRWYLVDQDAHAAAFRFIDAVDEAIEQLMHMPDAGAPRFARNPALPGLRTWPVKGFEQIRIYYVVQGDSLRVIRVLHGKRDLSRILEDESPESA